MSDNLHIGIIGAGGFASFAAKAFLKVPGISISAVSDINTENATLLASETNATVMDFESMCRDKDIDLIYIGTPPSHHYSQSKKALLAHKHVICEKPAALHTYEAEELARFAKENNLLYAVNLMQRYNPLYAFVKTLIDEKWLGEFVHGFFENYASDEKLVPQHWFWDSAQSGGIFIEHGVHFFDMFEGWLGKGELIHSMEIARPDVHQDVIDRVQAVVMYGHSPVNFYHGFNQPKLLDRQELRLKFERGDITLYEWIPVRIRMHGLWKEEHITKIRQHFPDADIETLVTAKESKYVTGNFKEISFDELMTITSGDIGDKMSRYEELVIAMISDQWSWIKDHSHKRVTDSTNAVESLRIAEEATRRAQRF